MTDPLRVVDDLEALLEDAEAADAGVASGARTALRQARRAVESALAQRALSEPDEILRAARQVRRSLLVGLSAHPGPSDDGQDGCTAEPVDRPNGSPMLAWSTKPWLGGLSTPAPSLDGRGPDPSPARSSERTDPAMAFASDHAPSREIDDVSPVLEELEAIGRQRLLNAAERQALDSCRRTLQGRVHGMAVDASSVAVAAALTRRALVLALHTVAGTTLPVSEPADATEWSSRGPGTPVDFLDRPVPPTLPAIPQPTPTLRPQPTALLAPPPPLRPPAPSPIEEAAPKTVPDSSTVSTDVVVPVDMPAIPKPVPEVDADELDLLDPVVPPAGVPVEERDNTMPAVLRATVVEPASIAVPVPQQRVVAGGRPPARAISLIRGTRTAGVMLILFVVYALFGTALLEGRAQRSLSAASHSRLTNADIGLNSLVMGTDTRRSLAQGPGTVPGSGLPGSDRPLVIVGNRTTNGAPFRHLSALHPGGRVLLHTADGHVLTYMVERSVTTTPHGTIQESAGSQTLLLVSATPPYHDSERLVVVARLKGDGNRSIPAQTIRLPGLGGSPVDLAGGLLVLGLLALMWGVRAARRQTLPVWIRWGSWVPAVGLAYFSWQLLLGSMSRLL